LVILRWGCLAAAGMLATGAAAPWRRRWRWWWLGPRSGTGWLGIV
jgi:hypothetical protein